MELSIGITEAKEATTKTFRRDETGARSRY